MSEIVVTDAQKDIGAHVLSEWLDDEAPLHERRYRDPAEACFKAMLEVVIPPDDIRPLDTFRGVFSRAADVMAFYRGKDDTDAKVLRALADSILPGVKL
jgi:hypothetical protein